MLGEIERKLRQKKSVYKYANKKIKKAEMNGRCNENKRRRKALIGGELNSHVNSVNCGGGKFKSDDPL